MAFNGNNFVRSSSQANGFAQHSYLAEELSDTISVVKAAGYFNDAAATWGLKNGEFIYILCNDGTSIIQVAVNAGVVTTDLALDFA